MMLQTVLILTAITCYVLTV